VVEKKCILEDMNALPSPENKKGTESLLILFGMILITALVSFAPASWFGVRPANHAYAPLNLDSLDAVQTAGEDSNGDGSISWKEFVAGSLNLSPDSLSSTTTFSYDPREVASLNDPNNLTSSFSKNLYIASTALEQNGVTDSTSEQETINQLIKKEAEKVQPTTYTSADVKVGTSDSSASLKTYGNAVASILNGFITQQSIIDDIQSIGSFSDTKSEADLAALIRDSAKVSEALQKLRAVSVPPSAVATHVQALNNIGTFSNTLGDMSRAYDDPVRATLAFNRYSEDAVKALQTFPFLASFFKTKNITFGAKDSGYVYIVGYTGK
jgi:hypothetical protein